MNLLQDNEKYVMHWHLSPRMFCQDNYLVLPVVLAKLNSYLGPVVLSDESIFEEFKRYVVTDAYNSHIGPILKYFMLEMFATLNQSPCQGCMITCKINRALFFESYNLLRDCTIATVF